ncbi:MAG: hypothetical protein Q8Q35_01930 [Nanoarchaeota archaeon]|nr:hypothetical protein [Nanoarchaeota archaeon]
MRRDKIIEYGMAGVIGVMILLIIILMIGGGQAQESVIEINTEEGFKMISTGSTETGDALIELKPKSIVDNIFTVDIAVNTHSVDMSPFDLKEIVTLAYGDKMLNPIEAPSLSGHHISGELLFEVEEELESFSIVIEGIPLEEERTFIW